MHCTTLPNKSQQTQTTRHAPLKKSDNGKTEKLNRDIAIDKTSREHLKLMNLLHGPRFVARNTCQSALIIYHPPAACYPRRCEDPSTCCCKLLQAYFFHPSISSLLCLRNKQLSLHVLDFTSVCECYVFVCVCVYVHFECLIERAVLWHHPNVAVVWLIYFCVNVVSVRVFHGGYTHILFQIILTNVFLCLLIVFITLALYPKCSRFCSYLM